MAEESKGDANEDQIPLYRKLGELGKFCQDTCNNDKQQCFPALSPEKKE